MWEIKLVSISAGSKTLGIQTLSFKDKKETLEFANKINKSSIQKFGRTYYIFSNDYKK